MGRYRNVQTFTLGATSLYPRMGHGCEGTAHNRWGWLRALCAAVLIFLPAAGAQASATYQWKSGGDNGCCEVLIEITNEAYAAGAVAVHIQQAGAPQAFAGNPVIRFQVTGYGDRLVFDRDHVRGIYGFDLTLVEGSLSGGIHANDLSTDTLLSGNQDQWTVQAHHSDHPGDCFRAENICSGAKGRWVLVSPPTE
jgi:hypothetical protein